MIHGPGCPVCVTPLHLIDKAIELLNLGVIVCSFGDMIRVPGSQQSLLEAKAKGGDLRILYSPLEAVNIARSNPDKEVVFLPLVLKPRLLPMLCQYFMHKKKALQIIQFLFHMYSCHLLWRPY
jgi:hydrogenase expression/formation protein HypD